MTKEEIIEYLYENNVRGDLTIEQMAEDLDRQQGEWIRTTPWSYGAGMGEVYGYYQKCSNCGKEFMDKSNFCPNCGTKMK